MSNKSSVSRGGALRIKAGAEYIGIADATYYDHLDPKSRRHDPRLPKPLKLSPGASAFLVNELDEYLEYKAAQRFAVVANLSIASQPALPAPLAPLDQRESSVGDIHSRIVRAAAVEAPLGKVPATRGPRR